MMENSAHFVSALLDIGEIMLQSGAEVNRVETTITHMAFAYGFSKFDVFTITSCIIITAHEKDGEILTQCRHVTGYDTNLNKIERCNAISRDYCKEKMTIPQLQERIESVRTEQTHPQWIYFLFYGLGAAFFTGFFGGEWMDIFCALLGGFWVRIVQLAGKRLKVQNIVLTLVCSFASALMVVALTRLGIGSAVDMIMMGNIMLFIPGIALTSSVRDLISGDLISGMLGVCEAVVRAVAIAAGVALVVWMMGGVL